MHRWSWHGVYGWPVLGLALQSRGEGGLPSTRGDDKLLMYLVHNVEDEIVFLDIQDLLDGTYTAIGRYAGSLGVPFPRHLVALGVPSVCPSLVACRLRVAGSYRLSVVLRGCHIMGSPFNVLVHATEPWPPASE